MGLDDEAKAQLKVYNRRSHPLGCNAVSYEVEKSQIASGKKIPTQDLTIALFRSWPMLLERTFLKYYASNYEEPSTEVGSEVFGLFKVLASDSSHVTLHWAVRTNLEGLHFLRCRESETKLIFDFETVWWDPVHKDKAVDGNIGNMFHVLYSRFLLQAAVNKAIRTQ
jgi:hypothetical protein